MVSGDHHPKVAPIIRIKFGTGTVIILFEFSGQVSAVLSGGGVSMVLGVY